MPVSPFFDDWLDRQPWGYKFAWFGGLGLILDIAAIYWATQSKWHDALLVGAFGLGLSGYAFSIFLRKPAPTPNE